MNPENIPFELKALPQWVNWKKEQRGGKATKVPYHASTGKLARVDDPSTWSSFEQALAAYQNGNEYTGIGYIFTEQDPYVGIDLDGCIDDEGRIADWALQIILQMNSYTEYSQSRKGLHILAKGKLPAGGRRKGSVEMYDSGRYFVMTGDVLDELPLTIEERTQELAAVYAQFGSPEEPKKASTETGIPPCGCASDVLSKMRRASNWAEIERLLNGDWGGYSSQSEGDLALCCHAAFYSRSPEVIDAVYRGSALLRGKWDTKHYGNGKTYGEVTIEKALEKVTKQYGKRFTSPSPSATKPIPTASGMIQQLRAKIRQSKEAGILGIDPGFRFLKKTIDALIASHLWIVGGYTSTGKTALAVELISRIINSFSWVRIAVFSLEMSTDQYLLRLAANRTGIPSLAIMKGQHIPSVQETIDEAFESLSKKNLVIYDDLYRWQDIADTARRIKREHGLDVMVLDYIQNIVGDGTIYERMSRIAPELQALAKELDCTVIALSQVSNEAVRENTGVIAYKGAGEIAAAADLGLWLERVKDERGSTINSDTIDVVIRKNRHGALGKATLRFINNFTKLEEV